MNIQFLSFFVQILYKLFYKSALAICHRRSLIKLSYAASFATFGFTPIVI